MLQSTEPEPLFAADQPQTLQCNTYPALLPDAAFASCLNHSYQQGAYLIRYDNDAAFADHSSALLLALCTAGCDMS